MKHTAIRASALAAHDAFRQAERTLRLSRNSLIAAVDTKDSAAIMAAANVLNLAVDGLIGATIAAININNTAVAISSVTDLDTVANSILADSQRY